MKIIPVDKNALLNDLSAMCIDDYDYEVCSEVLDMIDQAPVLDYAPVVHAHWDYYSGGIIRPHFRCSACSSPRYEHYAVNEFKYCPSCGARMDEEAKQ